jgi:hypothetical protein
MQAIEILKINISTQGINRISLTDEGHIATLPRASPTNCLFSRLNWRDIHGES